MRKTKAALELPSNIHIPFRWTITLEILPQQRQYTIITDIMQLDTLNNLENKNFIFKFGRLQEIT